MQYYKLVTILEFSVSETEFLLSTETTSKLGYNL